MRYPIICFIYLAISGPCWSSTWCHYIHPFSRAASCCCDDYCAISTIYKGVRYKLALIKICEDNLL